MKSRLSWAALTVYLLAIATAPLVGQDKKTQPEPTPKDERKSRLVTFEKASGETYFALSLQATERLSDLAAADIVVLFDTSASQTGLYRDDSLACLEALLDNLRAADRVHLMALDLEAVPMHESMTPKGGKPLVAAVEKLKQRTPLGSTNLIDGVTTALKSFDDKRDAARAVVYIGDGLSRANFVTHSELDALLAALAKSRASVLSFAIGPQRDIEFLAALANHSGGLIFVDEESSDKAHRVGAKLAQVVRAPVLWPVDTKLSEGVFAESYPRVTPPLRMDRDSILLGVLKKRAPQTIEVTFAGPGERKMTWKVRPESSSDDFAFLPRLVELARKDGGSKLPTAGSVALKEAGRVILSDAQTLVKLGAQALKRGDLKAAERAVKAVLDRDPDNPEAGALKRAVLRKQRELERKAAKLQKK